VPGVGEGALLAADGHPGVEDGQGVGVQRDDAFGVEFAQRHFEPGAVSGEFPQAVQFEVQQFPEP
jgi:hypothetical protein